jgi:hypothetical protein
LLLFAHFSPLLAHQLVFHFATASNQSFISVCLLLSQLLLSHMFAYLFQFSLFYGIFPKLFYLLWDTLCQNAICYLKYWFFMLCLITIFMFSVVTFFLMLIIWNLYFLASAIISLFCFVYILERAGRSKINMVAEAPGLLLVACLSGKVLHFCHSHPWITTLPLPPK